MLTCLIINTYIYQHNFRNLIFINDGCDSTKKLNIIFTKKIFHYFYQLRLIDDGGSLVILATFEIFLIFVEEFYEKRWI